MDKPKILIMGIGNVLLSDDGFGVHVVHKLKNLQEQDKFDKNIEIVDGGAAGIDILYYIEDQDILIFVDAIKGGNEPGYIYEFRINNLNLFKEIKITSLHDLELTSVLKIAKEMGTLPKNTYLVGVEPENYTQFSMELTPKIKEKIDEIIDIIKKIIQKQF
ncbi:MAG: hydrogenase maturation protease [Candidatus Helarchaeota archaeon]